MLVSVSGIDGSGKSTQLDLVNKYCETHKWNTISIWTRGGYTSGFNRARSLARRVLGSHIPAPGPSAQRDHLLNRSSTQSIWLALAMLDLFRVYCFQLRWWQVKYEIVLCDRYLWDAQIDFEIMFPGLRFHSWPLWRLLWELAPNPNCAFLLWLPIGESIHRCEAKQEPFPDSLGVKEIRYAKYQDLAVEGHLTVVDAQLPIADVTATIVAAIHSRQRRVREQL